MLLLLLLIYITTIIKLSFVRHCTKISSVRTSQAIIKFDLVDEKIERKKMYSTFSTYSHT